MSTKSITCFLFLLLSIGLKTNAQQNLIYARESNTGDLYSLNPNTASASYLVNTGTNNFLNKVSCINYDSSWYIFLYNNGTNIQLQTIDLVTNSIKYDVKINSAYTKLDYNPNNHLIYALISKSLYSINPANGATNYITNLSSSAINQATAIDPIHNYYYSLGLGSINGVDLITGASLNSIAVTGTVYSLFYNCSTQSLYAFMGDIYKVNTQTGFLQLVVNVPLSSYVYGTACVDLQNGFFYFQDGVSPSILASINLNSNSYNSIALSPTISSWQVLGSCDFLYANAGNDKNLCSPGGSTTMNSSYVRGGTGKYHYKWSPSNLLNNDSILHPTATCTSTTKFILTVYDSITSKSSIDSMFVFVLPSTSTNVTKNICTGNSLLFNHQLLNIAGFYSDTLVGYMGCDSFINLTLHVNQQTTYANFNGFGCGNFSIYNKMYYSSGVYHDTIPNYLGCDSIITLFISIDSTNAMFQVFPDDFTPHLWYILNLSTGKAPIKYIWNWGDGTVDTTNFNPQHIYQNAGYYDICLQIIDSVGCTDLYCDSIASYIFRLKASNSMVIVNVVDTIPKPKLPSIDKPTSIKFFPNPATNLLYYKVENFEISKIEIWDEIGKMVLVITPNTSTTNKVDISKLSSGVYYVKTLGINGIQFIDKVQIQY